jgi:hypothetical protein
MMSRTHLDASYGHLRVAPCPGQILRPSCCQHRCCTHALYFIFVRILCVGHCVGHCLCWATQLFAVGIVLGIACVGHNRVTSSFAATPWAISCGRIMGNSIASPGGPYAVPVTTANAPRYCSDNEAHDRLRCAIGGSAAVEVLCMEGNGGGTLHNSTLVTRFQLHDGRRFVARVPVAAISMCEVPRPTSRTRLTKGPPPEPPARIWGMMPKAPPAGHGPSPLAWLAETQ